APDGASDTYKHSGRSTFKGPKCGLHQKAGRSFFDFILLSQLDIEWAKFTEVANIDNRPRESDERSCALAPSGYQAGNGSRIAGLECSTNAECRIGIAAGGN